MITDFAVDERRGNPGPQTMFLESAADIVLYGGKPGGGKTAGLFLEFSRHIENPNFQGLIMRRIREDITKIGGIWSAAKKWFEPYDPKVNESDLTLTFPSGAVIAFGSMKDERGDHERYKSIEIDLLAFEEMGGDKPSNGIEEHQFLYLQTRVRGFKRSGIRGYVRATSNPAPGWIFRMLLAAGYVDREGFAIPEMSGVIRWFYTDENTNQRCWFDSKEEAESDIRAKGFVKPDGRLSIDPTSFTFILASAEDNPFLDEDYESKTLSNLRPVERQRLKYGNWKIENDENGMFKRTWWDTSDKAPYQKGFFKKYVRAWDIAATEKDPNKAKDPAFTAGVLMAITHDDRFWILEAEQFRKSPAGLKDHMKAVAARDRAKYGVVTNTIPMDPGAAGKIAYESMAANLVGFLKKPMPTIGEKAVRAEGLADAAENTLVTLVIDPLDTNDVVDILRNQASTFPFGKFKDLIDAASDAYDFLTERARGQKVKPNSFGKV